MSTSHILPSGILKTRSPSAMPTARQTTVCESAWRLTPDRRRTLTLSGRIQPLLKTSLSLTRRGARLEADQGQSSTPINTVGLYRVEVSLSAGTGKLKPAGGVSGAMKESVSRAFSYLLGATPRRRAIRQREPGPGVRIP